MIIDLPSSKYRIVTKPATWYVILILIIVTTFKIINEIKVTLYLMSVVFIFTKITILTVVLDVWGYMQ